MLHAFFYLWCIVGYCLMLALYNAAVVSSFSCAFSQHTGTDVVTPESLTLKLVLPPPPRCLQPQQHVPSQQQSVASVQQHPAAAEDAADATPTQQVPRHT
jgi:hypothetical protein